MIEHGIVWLAGQTLLTESACLVRLAGIKGCRCTTNNVLGVDLAHIRHIRTKERTGLQLAVIVRHRVSPSASPMADDPVHRALPILSLTPMITGCPPDPVIGRPFGRPVCGHDSWLTALHPVLRRAPDNRCSPWRRRRRRLPCPAR